MKSPRAYTMSELVQRSQFDKRTIAFYVQEKLLPRVGRRGPRTRYSGEFLDRLMFIRRIRDLQDTGRLRAVTLSEIRELMQSLSADDIRRALEESVSEDRLLGFFEEPSLDTTDIAFAAEDMAVHAMRSSAVFDSPLMEAPYASRSEESSLSKRRESMASPRDSRGRLETTQVDSARLPSSGESHEELESLLKEVEHCARIGAERAGGGLRERVTRVPISDEIVLSVRNIEDDDAHLVEKLARLLRRIGRLD